MEGDRILSAFKSSRYWELAYVDVQVSFIFTAAIYYPVDIYKGLHQSIFIIYHTEVLSACVAGFFAPFYFQSFVRV